MLYGWGSSYKIAHNGGGMASKGLRAITYQGTRIVEADYNPSHTTGNPYWLYRMLGTGIFCFYFFNLSVLIVRF